MANTYFSNGQLFPNEVHVQLNVLGAAMMNRVLREVNHGHVAALEQRCLVNLDMKLTEKVAQPAALGGGIGNTSVFDLCTRSRDNGLTFGGPRHQGVAKEDTEAQRGTTRVWASCPVSVGIGDERRCS